MADVSVKMGVSGISQFRSEINQAQASVKTYDSALKLAEKQFRATGNAEKFMQDKTTALQGKLAAQQSAVKSAEAALKKMTESGVNPASQAYQKMQQSLLNAQAAVLDTQNDINNLGTESADAAGKTEQLASSLSGLNKKVSLEQVINGISTITDGMEKAAAKATELGKAIWENITDAARWGDDTATQAMILNMDVEDYQRYKKVFDTVGELTVQEWQKAKMKVQKAINDPTQDQTDILNLLGINTHDIQQGKYGAVQGAARNFEDVFWDIGETLRRKVESGEMTQDLADTYANALFGRGFANMNPMFALGKEGFAAALEEQNVVTEESVDKLAGLNDQLIKLQGDFDSLQAEVLAGLAPALQSAAEVLDSLLGRLMDYLQTEEGKKALEDMTKAVEGLFTDLGSIDPQEVVEGFAGIFNGIVDGLKWLEENKGTVIGAMEAIVTGWAGLKLTDGILQIANLINGISGLTGAGAAAGAAEAGSAVGSAWGGGFAAAVMKAAPWLAGLAVLLTPSGGDAQESDLYNPDGTPTAAGRRLGLQGAGMDESTLDSGHLSEIFGEEAYPVTVAPEAEPDAADQIAAQVGTVTIPVRLDTPPGWGGGFTSGAEAFMHANGLDFVPWDGYPAILHKGERIVSAREAASRSFSSNLYVESMIMNNGMDAAGLAQAIAARNQRTMAGFGS